MKIKLLQWNICNYVTCWVFKIKPPRATIHPFWRIIMHAIYIRKHYQAKLRNRKATITLFQTLHIKSGELSFREQFLFGSLNNDRSRMETVCRSSNKDSEMQSGITQIRENISFQAEFWALKRGRRKRYGVICVNDSFCM